MNICTGGYGRKSHDEVVHDKELKNCPMCELPKKLNEYEEKIEELKNEVTFRWVSETTTTTTPPRRKHRSLATWVWRKNG